MKILAIHDGGSGCAYYRINLPLTELAKHEGFEVTWRRISGSLCENPPPVFCHGDTEGQDVVVGQRFYKHDTLPTWRRCNSPVQRAVYELDDDLFSVTRENTAAYGTFSQKSVQEAVRMHFEYANLLTVTSEYLGEALQKASGIDIPYTVLPNFIPEFVLYLPHDNREGRLRLGWSGGSSHLNDLKVAAEQVRRFIKRNSPWDLFVSGTDFRGVLKTPADRAFHVPWIHVVDRTELYYRTLDFDIGICPLLDTPFARSKSYIKALEYAARGIPTIASDVGPYREFIEHGKTGFLVKYEHEWLKYLEILANDAALREKMGASAKEKAHEYTIEGNYGLWADAYTRLFSPTLGV